jgi:predicted ATPase/DNA-binding SARP family transcriptional activator
MDIRILGPIEAISNGAGVALPNMPRRLLAALATRAGETCSSDFLIDALWGESAPGSAAKLLQVYVSQLRKALASPRSIRTRSGGYALDLSEASLDSRRFERLVERGRDALRADNPAMAASQLSHALALWTGSAYGEFAYEEFARSEAERLEELRLVAVEQRLDAELRLGRQEDVLPELQSLAGAHPLREHLQAQTMLALYRSGRQTEALEHYSSVRARLREELGLEPASELRDLQRQILQQDPVLSSPATTEAVLTDLPTPPNTLVGRQRELTEVVELLARDDVRLLVLTGAGGSGKTRLAIEAARAAAPAFANGAAFVELAPLHDPALVPAAIARVLALDEASDERMLTRLTRALRMRQLLLVLDNAEHLRDAAPLYSEILAQAPNVSLLVTSRAVLHLSGEHVYPVQPLAHESAVELFMQRARDADHRFEPHAADEKAISRICTRLDGLPLAIELAAARTRLLHPTKLLERLEPRLPLLTGGLRDLPTRQQTLRATIEWSFHQLSPDQAQLAASIGVFVGSFDLEEAITICEADVDALTELVEQSLLSRTRDGRFVYLETIREFALELLACSPRAEETRRRHLNYFLQLAQGANIAAVRRPGAERLDLAAVAQDNLRGALEWAVAGGPVALGLELAIAMERFWVTRDPSEGVRWFAALLDRPEAEKVPPVVRANALRAFGGAADMAGCDEAAERLYEQSLVLFERLGDEHGRAVLLHRLGISAMRRGDLKEARSLVETSDAIHQRANDQWGRTQTIGTLGAIARDAGDDTRAYELIELSAGMAREVGIRWWESGMLAELANLSVNAGHLDDAELRARESLEHAATIGDRAGIVFGLGILAGIAAEQGQRERAEYLWRAIGDERTGAPLGGWRRHRATYEARIRELLGPAAVQIPADQTRPTLDQAVLIALEENAPASLARQTGFT